MIYRSKKWLEILEVVITKTRKPTLSNISFEQGHNILAMFGNWKSFITYNMNFNAQNIDMRIPLWHSLKMAIGLAKCSRNKKSFRYYLKKILLVWTQESLNRKLFEMHYITYFQHNICAQARTHKHTHIYILFVGYIYE